MRIYKPIAIILLFLVSCTSKENNKKDFTSFDGTKIAYTDNGNGELVLLIHGFIVDGDWNWGKSELKKQLIKQGYRVIIPDLRGNGNSDKPVDENAYKNNAEVKDLMALIDHLETDNYVAVGYSRGAIVLANLLTKDKRITKAVFGGMGIGFTNPNWDRRIEFGNVFSGRTEPNKMTRGAVDFAKNLDVNFKIMGYLQDYQPETTIAELNNIEVETLVICGDDDLDNGNPKKLQEQLSNSKLSLVSGDHMSTPFSKNFAESIIEFLNE
ncbi:alpha/beta hydrolase [Mangrovimonas sp. AS39]|uniref:alpha/beta fold hydrolase n=1 Tax=Mangrovimonas futianensis TaxID=2895523 RepID=UPI001E5ACAEE|nr:alpha/beta hydrolase [Mangrovimonas futianensis]MCF1193142.1 alpha/beta hydrolase [Mangrovimonas futianensis]MCF1196827.1 alpha/beta hydrolase [Mangrovimonas futianensis]MCF1423263.1 alpha/beta hydrolase [Mangrovimonas futianensis]